MESCGFRDEAKAFTEKGYALIAASCNPKDTPEAMKAFKDKHQLPYTMLSDTEANVASVFGIKPGTRQTVVIGKDGKLERIYTKAVPKEHPAEVLKDLGAKK